MNRWVWLAAFFSMAFWGCETVVEPPPKPEADFLELTATSGEIQQFLGGKDFKLAIAYQKTTLIQLTPGADASSAPTQDTLYSGNNQTASPLYSADGKFITYDTDLSKIVVVQKTDGDFGTTQVEGSNGAYDPHWYSEGGSQYLIYSDKHGRVNFDTTSKVLDNNTYMADFDPATLSVTNDRILTLGGTEVKGAYKGGVTKDGAYVGTTYGQSLLFHVPSAQITMISPGKQKCNASINPFPSGSANNDYIMLLGFGGSQNMLEFIDGSSEQESQHEHLLLYNTSGKVLWRAKLPGTMNFDDGSRLSNKGYKEWQKPEWSTHPLYATAIAKVNDEPLGWGYEVFIVKMAEDAAAFANDDVTQVMDRKDVLRVAKGNLSGSDWTHLWVAE